MTSIESISPTILFEKNYWMESTLVENLLSNIVSSNHDSFISGIFGLEVESVAAQVFSELSAETFPLPVINFVPPSQIYGHAGAYHHPSNSILVSRSLLDAALTDDEGIYILAGVLIEEFGHHLDVILRQYSGVSESDAAADEGAQFGSSLLEIISTLIDTEMLMEDEEIAICSMKSESNGVICTFNITFSELISNVSIFFTAEEILSDNKTETMEFFGAGKPHSNTCTHYTIEQDAMADARDLIIADVNSGAALWVNGWNEAKFSNNLAVFTGFTYLGNWSRDLSQLVDIKPLASGLSRGELTKIVAVMGHKEFRALHWPKSHSFVGSVARVVAPGGRDRWDQFISQGELGVYLPWEHIDNPKGLADGQPYNFELREAFRPVEIDINSDTKMKNYIGTPSSQMGDSWYTSKDRREHGLEQCGVANNWMSSKEYVQRMLNLAGSERKTRMEGLYLGNALHTIEDFYAHTNYIEISCKLLGQFLHDCNASGHTTGPCRCAELQGPSGDWNIPDLPNLLMTIDPWAAEQTGSPTPFVPLVTGTFTPLDIVASLSDKLVDVLAPGNLSEQIIKETSSVRTWHYTHKHKLISIILKSKGLRGAIFDAAPPATVGGLTRATFISSSNSIGSYYDLYIETRVAWEVFKNGAIYRIISTPSHLVDAAFNWVLDDWIWINECINHVIGVVEKIQVVIQKALFRTLMELVRDGVKPLQTYLGGLAESDSVTAADILAAVPEGLIDADSWGSDTTDPTHTMIAKDCRDSPFHFIAGGMARNTVTRFVYRHLYNRENRIISPAVPESIDIDLLVNELFLHPSTVNISQSFVNSSNLGESTMGMLIDWLSWNKNGWVEQRLQTASQPREGPKSVSSYYRSLEHSIEGFESLETIQNSLTASYSEDISDLVTLKNLLTDMGDVFLSLGDIMKEAGNVPLTYTGISWELTKNLFNQSSLENAAESAKSDWEQYKTNHPGMILNQD